MFKQAPDQMIPDPTPERVFAVCRMIAHQSMTRNDLRDALSLGNPSKSNYGEFNAALSVAQNDLNAIQSKDDKLELAISVDKIQSPEAFRRFVSSRVFTRKDSSFVLFTKWYIAQNEKVFLLDTWEVKAKTAAKEVKALESMSENDALGWRFWAAFLGIGYLSGTTLLPNMKIRLQDILVSDFPDTYKYNEPILAKDFISWLNSELVEVDMSTDIPMAVSAGLRTLHELGLIKLESRRDADRVALYDVDGDPINDFSHITVGEEVCK